MPVDEFGREIPAVGGGGGEAGGGGTSSSAAARRSRSRSRSRSRDRDDDWRTGGGGEGAGAGGGGTTGGGRSAADDLARDPFGLDARGSTGSGGGGGGSGGGDSSSRGGGGGGGGGLFEGRGRRGDRGDDRGGGSGGRSRGRSRGASFGGGGGSGSGTYYGPADGDRDRDRDRDGDRGGGSSSSRREGSRSGRPRSRSSRRGGGGGKGSGGGGGGDYYGPSGGGGRRRSPSPESGHYGSSSSRRRSGGGGGGGRHSHGGGGGGGHHHHHHHHHNHHGPGHGHPGGGGGGGGRRHKAHPSERYVDGPLLCEYLWNEEVKGGDNKDNSKEDNTEEKKVDDVAEDGDDDDDDDAKEEHDDGGHDDEDDKDKPRDENEDSANANADEAKKENDAEDDNGSTAKDEGATTTTTTNTTYSNYVSTYCLSYVRTFFNDHLDDAWFRNRYSPLERRRVAQTERDRKAYEARIMIAGAAESLEEEKKKNSTTDDNDSDNDNDNDKPCDFVLAARLSGGKKPGAAGAGGGGGGDGVGMDSALPSSRDGDAGGISDKRGGGSAAAPSDVPRSHVHASVSSNRTLRILDVPCHVTNTQLADALADHVDLPAASGKGSNGGIVAVYPTTVGGGDSHGSASGVGTYDHWKRRDGGSGGGDFLDRSCFVVMESVEARENLLENLTKVNEDSHRRRHRGDKDKGKGPAAFLELDVDCTDPYGRYDIDADGKGSGPANADEFGPDDEDNPGKLPIRRATVFVATASPFSDQPTSVLSAAVSSSARIGRDGAQAITISRALDVAAAIPRGTRLDDLLELLFPAGTGALESASSSPDRRQEAEDILDVTISYLRRVHLFSFYNGCTSADNLGDVLGGKHPSSTIHLRLSGADEILKKAEEEAEAPFDEGKPESDPKGGTAEDGSASVTKDLLVRRLDESISKALEEMTSSVIAASSDDCPVDDKTNVLAKEIEAAEEAVTPTWINDHALVDEDGRARCSFHFCRKLFKDRKFLEKHLVKKHSEHLRAEKAKCHDGHMMKAWDAEEVRPVPPVLVDCGSRFGMVPSNVVGAEPVAEDPEPGLWAKEEERRAKIEEEQRQRRERRAAAAEADGDMDDGLGAGSKRPRGASGNFVDVDDMQDEKVELSFEAIEVPVPQPKKKKKKRKLL